VSGARPFPFRVVHASGEDASRDNRQPAGRRTKAEQETRRRFDTGTTFMAPAAVA
jgi:hypothetical protein